MNKQRVLVGSDEQLRNNINDLRYRKAKIVDLETLKKEREENLISWITYFRENPARFAVDYLGIQKLTIWQRIILHWMFKSDEFLWIASRGIGKTFLIWLYCIIRCILYPGTKIVYTSITQAAAVAYMLEKVGELCNNYPNVAAEIANIDKGSKNPGVFFHNGSSVLIRPPSNNALGARANCIVIDEYRYVNNDVIEKVFKKFLTSPRQPYFMELTDDNGNKLYPDYPKEQNIEIYISSQAPTYEPAYSRFVNAIKNMINKNNPFRTTAICTPYYLGVKDGIITRERIIKELREEGADMSVFALEYECIPYGTSDKSYFTNEMFARNRTITDIFIPMDAQSYARYSGDLTKNPFYKPKIPGEIRLLGVDTALSGNNANSIVICLRLIPTENKNVKKIDATKPDKYFEKHVVYIKNINESLDPEYQAMIIKRIFYLFEADYIAIDTHGASLSVIYEMVKTTYDRDYDIQYKAFDSINDQKTSEKCKVDPKDRQVVMFNINVAGGSAQDIQHEYNTYTRSELVMNRIKFPAMRSEGETHLREKYNYDKQDAVTQAEWISVFLQCDALIAEAVNLERVITSNSDTRVILSIPKRSTIKRRDRIIALQYALYYAQKLETEMFKHKSMLSVSDIGNTVVVSGNKISRNPFGNNFNKLRGFGWNRRKIF